MIDLNSYIRQYYRNKLKGNINMNISNAQILDCFKQAIDDKNISLSTDSSNRVILTINGQKYLATKDDMDRMDQVAFIDAITDFMMNYSSGIRIDLLVKNPILYHSVKKTLFNRALDAYTEALKLISESEGKESMFDFIA